VTIKLDHSLPIPNLRLNFDYESLQFYISFSDLSTPSDPGHTYIPALSHIPSMSNLCQDDMTLDISRLDGLTGEGENPPPVVSGSPGHEPPVPADEGSPLTPRIPGELVDRIDYIWTTPCVEILSCDNVDDLIAIVPARDEEDEGMAADAYKWPSDHSAVIARIRCTPIPAIPMIAVSRRRINPGEDIDLYVCVPPGFDFSVCVVWADRPASEAITGLYNERLSYRRRVRFGSNLMKHGESNPSPVPYSPRLTVTRCLDRGV
jgi:hypothetical protein